MKKFKKNQKGFTLVEIIAVLLILAILAAAAIPTMLGFVDEAKGKSEIANARAAFVAAQTIATETYVTTSGDQATKDTACETDITDAEVAKLTGIDSGDFTLVKTNADDLIVTAGKVTKITYEGKTHTVVITAGGTAEVTEN